MRTTTRIGTAALAGFLLVITGCGGRGPSTGAGSAADGVITSPSSIAGEPVGLDELAGRTYLSTAVTGHTLADGTVISLRFGGGELTANAGCNTMSGTYRTSGGRLTSGGMRIDKPIPCPSSVSEETSWLAGFLGSRPSWRMDGHRLVLVSGPATIELTDRTVVGPGRPVASTTWQLTGLVDRATASSVPAGAPVPVLPNRTDAPSSSGPVPSPEATG